MVSLMNFEEINDQAIARIRLEYDNYPDRNPYQNLPEILSNKYNQNDNFVQDENQNEYQEQNDREDSNEEQKMGNNYEADNNATDDNYEQDQNGIKKKIKQKKIGRPKVPKNQRLTMYQY
eukprot:403343329